jgi:seryl-tRNA synthetase
LLQEEEVAEEPSINDFRKLKEELKELRNDLKELRKEMQQVMQQLVMDI